MEYFNLVAYTCLVLEINLAILKIDAKMIRLEMPGNISIKDQEVAYSDKAVIQVVPYIDKPEFTSSIVPVGKSNHHGIKLYEIHPVVPPPIVPASYASVSPAHSLVQNSQHLNKENPLLTTYALSESLGAPALTHQGTNHPELIPLNPYIALLLSQYGRYLPLGNVHEKGIYFYSAANNYHNNKPFGSYKVYEETRK